MDIGIFYRYFYLALIQYLTKQKKFWTKKKIDAISQFYIKLGLSNHLDAIITQFGDKEIIAR